MRKWSNWNTCLFGGSANGVTILKKGLAVSYRTNAHQPYEPAIAAYIPKMSESHVVTKGLVEECSQQPCLIATNWKSPGVHQQKNRQTVVYSYKRILFSKKNLNKLLNNITTWMNVKTLHCVKKDLYKSMYCRIPFIWNARMSKSIYDLEVCENVC